MNTKRKILSILLTAILLLSNLPVTATATNMFSSYSITKFNALPDNVSEQSVPLGMSLNALTLPDTLTASVLTESNIEEEIIIHDVTWDSIYNPDSFGDYFFTAVLPQGYTPVDGVLLPVITITVEKAEIVGSQARTPATTLTVAFNGSNMATAITDALSTASGTLNQADVTIIKVTGNATSITGNDWSSLIECFASSTWTALNTLDLSDMGSLITIGHSSSPNSSDKLTTVNLPDGVTTIGMSAFSNCTSLALTSLPAGVTTISNNAFWGCTSLALTSLPAGVITISNSAFFGCTSLALTSLPAGVTTIGNGAFSDCTSLALTSLPAGLTTIGEGAFTNCTSLALTSLPDGVITIGMSAFSNCTSLALTSLPAGVTTIGEGAFLGCTSLALTSLPAGVTTIGYNAFANCTSITELTLPSALIDIANYAFQNCSNLNSITFMSNTPPTIGTEAFDGISTLGNVYVPLGSTGYNDTWKNSNGFQSYMIYGTPPAGVTFTANPASINLANPTAIELVANDYSLLDSYTYDSLSFKNLTTGGDYTMFFTSGHGIDIGKPWFGLIYNSTTGKLIIPATAFSPTADLSHAAHNAGALLTPGAYRAKIVFEDAGIQFFYEVDFSLTDILVKYRLTVQEGTGGGNYEKGKAVTIKANDAPEGKAFDRWESNNGGTFADENSETTTFTMPGNNVTVTAVYKEVHSLTVRNGLGSGNYEKGEIVTIGANTAPTGIIFDRWITDNGGTFANANSEVTTFTMPENNVTVTAVYNNIDNGGGSITDGNNNTNENTTPPLPTSEYIICNTVKIEYSRKNSLLSSDITAQAFSSIVDKALKDTDGSKTIKMDFSTVYGASSLHSLDLTFDAEYINRGENITFIIETPFGVFIFTTEQMADWFDERFGKYTVTLEKSSLKVDVSKGGKSVKWDDLTPMARIGVPYRLKIGENASNVVVTDKNGSILPTSVYENGMIYADIFASGKYNSIAKKPVTYTDTGTHWAKADIDFVTMRGLIGSSQSNIYNTDTAITRADYLMSLGKLSGADISNYKKSSFSDVSNYSEAMPYIEWAVLNGIVVGIGENKFAPDLPITREEMSQMMKNYARALGFELPVINSVCDYADNSDISKWADEAVISMQKAGIMTGKNNNMFDPQGSTTRAESAAILRRFVEYVISSRFAEGWSNDNNDLKKHVYYNQNGVSLTGWQNIDGDMYYFYKNGTLAVNTTIEGYKVDKNGVRKN